VLVPLVGEIVPMLGCLALGGFGPIFEMISGLRCSLSCACRIGLDLLARMLASRAYFSLASLAAMDIFSNRSLSLNPWMGNLVRPSRWLP
jgi:hypothetical protein